MPKKKKHILVVNDTEEIQELFVQILHGEAGYEVTVSSFEPLMMDLVKRIKPDLIISDHVFGEEKYGWQFVQRLKMDRDTMQIPLIVCSGAVRELKDIEGYLQAKNVGVLYKPFDVDELLEMVHRKLEESEDTELHMGGLHEAPEEASHGRVSSHGPTSPAKDNKNDKGGK
jgi:CheY-like chemotaxis protein